MLHVQFGKAPVRQFYACGSAELGSVVATVGTGSSMSRPNMTGEKGPQHGLLTWGHKLVDKWKLWVMKQQYGNEEEAIKVLRNEKTEEAFAQKQFPGGGDVDIAHFNPRAFLV